MLKRSPLIIFAFTFLMSLASTHAEQCEILFTPVSTKLVTMYLANDTFFTGRDLIQYSGRLSPQSNTFQQTLGSLPINSIYFDMGSGRAVALFEILDSPIYSNISQVVAIAYNKPLRADIKQAQGNYGLRFRYLHGNYVERMFTNGELDAYKGQVQLITDLYGPVIYSNNLEALLKIYWTLLKSGGDVFFALQIKARYDGVDVTNLEMVNFDGVMYADTIAVLKHWFSNMPGFELREFEHFRHNDPTPGSDSYESGVSIHLRKTDQALTPIPLVWKFTSLEAFPSRVFQTQAPVPLSQTIWAPPLPGTLSSPLPKKLVLPRPD